MSKKYLYYFSEGNDAFGGDKVTMKNTPVSYTHLDVYKRQSVDPIACIGFDYIGDTYLDMDTVEIDTDNYRYCLLYTSFAGAARQSRPCRRDHL